MKEKNKFEKHDFDEKIIFGKQILKKFLHTKNHAWTHFSPWNAHYLRFTYMFKKHDFQEKIFYLKSMILNETVFLKSMILNETVFLKSMILNQIFFRLVRFWIKVFITCQILTQLFKHASDFDLKNIQHVRLWVYFFCSLPSFYMFSKTVRFAIVRMYGVGLVSQVFLLG